MKRNIERFETNGLKIIILLHDAITRVDLTEYKKLRKNSFKKKIRLDGAPSVENIHFDKFFKPNFEIKKYGRDSSVSEAT